MSLSRLIPVGDARRRWSHVCLVLSLVATLWAIALALGVTDGVIVELGVVRFTSRIPRNPVIIATLSAMAALVLAPAGTLRRMVVALPGTLGKLRLILATAWAWSVHRVARRWRVLQERLPQCAPVLAAGLAAGTITVAIAKGAFVAGGSDSYSYLSQAELWVHGTLRVEQPIMREVSWARAFAPLGYTLTPDRSAIVPITAPGYPSSWRLLSESVDTARSSTSSRSSVDSPYGRPM